MKKERTLTIRIGSDFRRELTAAAEADDRTITAYLMRAAREKMARSRPRFVRPMADVLGDAALTATELRAIALAEVNMPEAGRKLLCEVADALEALVIGAATAAREPKEPR